MENKSPLKISLVSIDIGIDGNLLLLGNAYQEPMNVDAVSSFIHEVSLDKNGFNGTAEYVCEEWLTEIHTISDSQIFACSMEGSLHIRNKDGAWNKILTGENDGLSSSYVNSNKIYVTTLNGNIFDLSSGTSKKVWSNAGIRLNRIIGCSDRCIYAFGDNGLVVHFNGTDWKIFPINTTANLLTGLCLHQNNLYIGGSEGTIFQWNGVVWKSLKSPKITISSIVSYKDKIFVAAGRSGIYVIDNDSLKQIKQVTLYNMVVSHGLLFAVGSDFLAWFDGEQWKGGKYILH